MNKGKDYGFAEDFPGQVDHSETGAGKPSAKNSGRRPDALRLEGDNPPQYTEIKSSYDFTEEKK